MIKKIVHSDTIFNVENTKVIKVTNFQFEIMKAKKLALNKKNS